jgi:hypothetical protein
MPVRDTLPVALGGCCRIAYTILSKTDLGVAAAADCCAAVAADLATFAVLVGGLDLESPPGAADATFFDLGDDDEDGMASYFAGIGATKNKAIGYEHGQNDGPLTIFLVVLYIGFWTETSRLSALRLEGNLCCRFNFMSQCNTERDG